MIAGPKVASFFLFFLPGPPFETLFLSFFPCYIVTTVLELYLAWALLFFFFLSFQSRFSILFRSATQDFQFSKMLGMCSLVWQEIDFFSFFFSFARHSAMFP